MSEQTPEKPSIEEEFKSIIKSFGPKKSKSKEPAEKIKIISIEGDDFKGSIEKLKGHLPAKVFEMLEKEVKDHEKKLEQAFKVRDEVKVLMKPILKDMINEIPEEVMKEFYDIDNDYEVKRNIYSIVMATISFLVATGKLSMNKDALKKEE